MKISNAFDILKEEGFCPKILDCESYSYVELSGKKYLSKYTIYIGVLFGLDGTFLNWDLTVFKNDKKLKYLKRESSDSLSSQIKTLSLMELTNGIE